MQYTTKMLISQKWLIVVIFCVKKIKEPTCRQKQVYTGKGENVMFKVQNCWHTVKFYVVSLTCVNLLP